MNEENLFIYQDWASEPIRAFLMGWWLGETGSMPTTQQLRALEALGGHFSEAHLSDLSGLISVILHLSEMSSEDGRTGSDPDATEPSRPGTSEPPTPEPSASASTLADGSAPRVGSRQIYPRS